MFVYPNFAFFHRCQTVNNILYTNHRLWGAIFCIGSRLRAVENCVWHIEFLSDCWTEPTFVDPLLSQYVTNWFCVLQVTSQPLPVSLHSQEASWMDGTNRSDCNVLSSNWEHILKCAAYIPWGFHHGITCGHCMAVVLIGNFVHPELPFRLPPAISAITWSTWLSPPEVSHTCEPLSAIACVSVLSVLC